MSTRIVKKAALRLLTRSPVASWFTPMTQGVATIFMLHRFAQPDLGIRGHDPAAVSSLLAYLRQEGYAVVPLGELVRRLDAPSPPSRKTVAFTVDDGYADFHEVGAPIFARFDCPVTVFLTTGFLDGELWLWWDRVRYAFANAAPSRVSIETTSETLSYSWTDERECSRAATRCVARLKQLPDDEKLAAVSQLGRALDVAVPPRPPRAFAAMTWDQVRADARRGVTFGPHTVTHPILARASSTQAEWEMRESWRRVQEETDGCVPVFCYPNGTADSFGARETSLVRSLGFAAGVSAIPGYASPDHFDAADPNQRFAVPRFAFSEDRAETIRVVSGLERFTTELRRRFAAPRTRPLLPCVRP